MEKGEKGDFPPRNVQSDTNTVTTATSDFPPKKLARQLDFTALGGASTTVVLPEHPQLNPLQQAQVHMPPQVVLTPVPPPTTLPVRPVKPESPRSRGRPNVEVKDGTPKRQKQCNCKHSRCLKLYCECFASGIYCDGCNCVNCYNNAENEAARRDAVEATLERNPNAFRPKIASSPHGPRDRIEEAGEVLVLAKHNKGCHCKKSGCLKKYCECFQANILCSENCKCMDCKNFEGSEERQAIYHGNHSNSMVYIQQAANAAITGAIGSSGYGSPPISKKRKGQELFFSQTGKDIHRLSQFQQANNMKTSAPSTLSSNPASRGGVSVPLGHSKFAYGSLLADIIHPQDVKELCSLLVVLAADATMAPADQKNASEKRAEDRIETSLASSSQDRLQNQKGSDVVKALADDRSSGNQADKIGTDDSNSDGGDLPKGRPMSPGTLALMCDEQDAMFMATASPNGLMGQSCNTSSQAPHGHSMNEVSVVKERVVMTKFRDCLTRLITYGEIKETKCSSLARNETGSTSNGARSETGNQPEPVSNGVTRTVFHAAKVSRTVPTAVGSASNSDPHSKNHTLSENGDIKLKTEKEL